MTSSRKPHPAARAQQGARVQSMTGYGRAAARTSAGTITVELRSTNHRYLEIDPRLPNGLAELEGPLAEMVRRSVRRGRIDAVVGVQVGGASQRRVELNEPLLARYHGALLRLARRFGLTGGVRLDHLLALPQALVVAEDRLPAERLRAPILHTAQAALEELVRSRRREGSRLAADVRRQLRAIDAHVRAVKRRLPKALEEQRRRLRERLLELLGPGAGLTAQVEQAAALAKEADIHEELVRLESHLGYMHHTLAGGRLVGKRLDFIAQELMREANTMGAKVNDARAAQHVVDLKGCVEKIREQVQNLE